ncbi:MAG: efflux RND transporter periplasmic adaptor subunit [Firmicutes bacterium]|nr:efflux RND transporter periplasmic adaptor subunit [Bacillota bacterium]
MSERDAGIRQDTGTKRFEPIIRRPPRALSGRTRRDLAMVLFVAIVLALVVGLPAYFLMPREKPYLLANYTYAEVRPGEFKDVVDAPGTVLPAHTVEIRAEVAGVVQKIMVTPGQEVKPGMSICILHSADLAARLEEGKLQALTAEDNLEKARLESKQTIERIERDLEDAKRDVAYAMAKLEDARKLYEAGAIPQKQVEEAQAEVDRAQSIVESKQSELSASKAEAEFQINACARQLGAARSSLKAIEDAMAGLVLRSPIAGKVLDVAVVPGATVSQGMVVAQVADLSRLVVKAKVDASDIRLVTAGQRATVDLGGRSLSGTVQDVAPRAEETGQGATVDVTVGLNANPGDVPPNSAAYVEIEVRQRSGVLYLPRGPFLASGQEMFVYVIEGDKAVQRDVRFGRSYGNAIEILEGLAAGEKVITSSYEEFKDRKEIRVLSEGGRQS